MPKYTVGCYTVTRNPNPEWLAEARASAEGLFDQYVLVDDGSDVPVEGADYRFDKNVGVAAARNKAISMLDTDWIAMVDDDDILSPDIVRALREVLGELDADVVSSPVAFFGDADLVWATEPDMSRIREANQIPAGSWFRKSVWEKLKYNETEAEDWDFWERAWRTGHVFAHIDKPLYKSRVRKGSRSSHMMCFGGLTE